MHKLDPHTLFSIFEKGDEEVYKENQMEGLLDNPYVLRVQKVDTTACVLLFY